MSDDDRELYFYCQECYQRYKIKYRGKATKEGEPYNACIHCCQEEQKRQFYAEM